MTLNARDGVGTALNAAAAGATKFNIYGYTAALSTQLIGAVTLDNDTFSDGDPSGTVVGAISVAMNATSPSFSGTFSVTGADAAHFQISGSNLETLGTAVEGTYSINIVATANSTIGNSPKSTAFTITGEAASGYTAQAVHFPSLAKLVQTGSSVPDAATWLFSGWFKRSITAIQTHPDLFTVQPNDVIPVQIGWDTEFNIGMGLQDIGQTTYFGLSSIDDVVVADVWQHVAWSVDMAHAAGQKIGQIFIDGVDATDALRKQDSSAAFSISFNGLTLAFTSTFPAAADSFDAADVVSWIGASFIDLSVHIAKFISAGKPVDPAVPIAAFGNPTIRFSGDATGFAANQGTGGAFTLTGTLTNASTSPSD